MYVDLEGNGVCVDKCSNVTSLNPATAADLSCKYDADTSQTVQTLLLNSECLPLYDSFSLLHRCIPNNPTEVLQTTNNIVGLNATSHFTDHLGNFEKFVSDIYYSAPVLFPMALAAPLVLGFVFLLLLRLPCLTSFIVWSSLLSLPLILGGAGYGAFWLHQQQEDADDGETNNNESWQKTAFLVSAIVLWVMAGLAVLLFFGVRKRVGLAIKCTKTAAHAAHSVPSTIFYPLFSLFFYIVFLTVWLVYLFFIASTGDLTKATVTIYNIEVEYSYYEYDDLAKYSFWFMLFVLFWTSQFFVAFGQIVLGLSFSKW